MPTPLAQDVINFFRSMEPTWKYKWASHDFNDKIADCQGTVDFVMRQFDLQGNLGPQLPWNVSYMVDHTTYRKSPATETPNPGDILVLGDPRSTDEREKYAHTGMATTPGTYISNYNVGINIIERTINNEPAMRLVLIIRTGFIQVAATEDDMLTVNGTATIRKLDGAPATSLAEVNPNIRLVTLDGVTTNYVKPTGFSYSVYGYNQNNITGRTDGPSWMVMQNGSPYYLLCYNAVATLVS